jgi:energy-coupling factor transporter transmembrane protein EcfT
MLISFSLLIALRFIFAFFSDFKKIKKSKATVIKEKISPTEALSLVFVLLEATE